MAHRDRWDFVCASALALLTVASRLPYRARMLYNWDAVQFALALREYDVMKHQPHPPGYVLYVALGRVANAWLLDEAAAYVLLAVVFSGLTTFVVYYLARAIYDRAVALAAASLLAVSPLFWFYGSVGLTYAAEALTAATVAYFSYRALRGSRTDAWLAAGYLGLAGGIRQSILVLLFPLWLGAVLVGAGPRVAAVGLGVLAVAVVTWFVPMIRLTGGLDRYLAASRDLAETVVMPTSIMSGAFEATLRMSRYVIESVLVGLGPLALAAVLVPWYVRRFGWSRRETFLAAWTIPPVVVYTLVHFGQAGYVLTFLPAIVILLSRVLIAAIVPPAPLAMRHPRIRAAVATAVIVAVVLLNGVFFVNARPRPRDFDAAKPRWQQIAEDEAFDWIFSRTAAALREHEAVVRTFVDTIRGLHDPSETIVLTELGNPRTYPWLRHAMFYLSEYTIFELRVGDVPPGYYAPRLSSAMTPFPDTEIHLPPNARRLVWFVDHWSPRSERPDGLVEIELPYGRFLYVLPLGNRIVEYAGYTFIRDDPPPRARRAAR
ncbi:MAG: DUF2723 domain-containing protein [Candidatus Rokubacteria bacterium]|nr:DUF2723 domain-containing protein [Candidatus Rokubacteria bacterium]